MVTYPIKVRGSSYRGDNPIKRQKAAEVNRMADMLTKAINHVLLQQKEPIRVYDWAEIADLSGLPVHVVKDLGYSIDCGDGGFTAVRHGCTYEEAVSEMRGIAG